MNELTETRVAAVQAAAKTAEDFDEIADGSLHESAEK